MEEEKKEDDDVQNIGAAGADDEKVPEKDPIDVVIAQNIKARQWM